MNAFELIYLGRNRFHLGGDAIALYFRVMQNRRYVGSFAGAVAGPDLAQFGASLPKDFWASLAHVTCRAIAVRLLAETRRTAELHVPDTIWVKAADVKAHLGQNLPLPVENGVFRSFTLEEDPLGEPEPDKQRRILSVGSSSISLKAAAARGQ